MTGSGTEQDPYIVDNWTDFSTIDITSSDIYVRWADGENKIIDFNDFKPEGFSETIFLPYSVNFNGWTLKNLHSTANPALSGISGSKPSKIYGLTLENFYFIGGVSFRYFEFQNCIFSGTAQSSSALSLFAYSPFANGAINVSLYGAAQITAFSYSECKNSDIVMTVTGNRFNITSFCNAYNSRFSGKIRVDSNDNVALAIGYSCVCNLESNRLLSSSGYTISIYNSDLSQATTSSQNFIGCTTEQLKDAEYLYNLGFPIGVD